MSHVRALLESLEKLPSIDTHIAHDLRRAIEADEAEARNAAIEAAGREVGRALRREQIEAARDMSRYALAKAETRFKDAAALCVEIKAERDAALAKLAELEDAPSHASLWARAERAEAKLRRVERMCADITAHLWSNHYEGANFVVEGAEKAAKAILGAIADGPHAEARAAYIDAADAKKGVTQ